jgi:hypothetical protein
MNTRDAGEPSRYRKIEGFYQTSGLYLIESYIATRLQAMAKARIKKGKQVSSDKSCRTDSSHRLFATTKPHTRSCSATSRGPRYRHPSATT